MAETRSTKAGVYIEVSGSADFVTKAGAYIEIGQNQVRASLAGIYLEILPLTTYTYRVRAYNDSMDSEYSNEANVSIV